MSHSPGRLSPPLHVEGRVVADAEAAIGGRLDHQDLRRETEIFGLDSLVVGKTRQDRRAFTISRSSSHTPSRGGIP